MQSTSLARGLRRVRRRRWYLWSLLLGYLPVIWVTLELTGSDRKTAVVFGVWVLLVLWAALAASVVSCPKCRKPFHLNGVFPLFLRRCVHCGQPLRGGED